MWYKNAWYEVIWNCDIDKAMIDVYKKNHKPKYSFAMWIWEFNKLDEIPQELFNIDILDWSPPCSTFSTSWLREKAWWKLKHFKEWQEKQVLDDLFFDFLDTVALLKPKVVIAENVSWMLKGNAKWYVKMIARKFDELWYDLQIFLLNGASMWLPQKRERVFFCAAKKEFKLPKLKIIFNEPPVIFKEIDEGIISNPQKPSNAYIPYWKICKPWKNLSTVHPKWHFFNQYKVSPYDVCNTIATQWQIIHHTQCRVLTKWEIEKIWSYPSDYDYNWVKPKYLIWMSVPPLMMYKLSKEIEKQWLSKI